MHTSSYWASAANSSWNNVVAELTRELEDAKKKMNNFPILIKDNLGRSVVVRTPDQLPTGIPFTILQTRLIIL